MAKDIKREEIPFSRADFKLSVLERSGLASTGASVPGAFHQAIEIKYFYEGTSNLLIGDEILSVGAGDIVIINPYEIHSTIHLSQDPGKYYLFMMGVDFFEDADMSGFDLKYQLLRKQLRFNHLVRKNERLQQILSQVVKEVQKADKHYDFVVRGLFLEFFALLMRSEVASIGEHTQTFDDEMLKYYDTVDPALQKIRDCYFEKLTIEDLAGICNVSNSHFCRIFKKVTNMTVVDYITNYRFKAANLMMMQSEYSIGEIARQCGFDDESYFCRCYKKKFGISPKKNRAQLSQK